MYWLVGLAFAVTAGLVVALRFRQIKHLRDDIRSGRKDIDDTWDPFT